LTNAGKDIDFERFIDALAKNTKGKESSSLPFAYHF